MSLELISRFPVDDVTLSALHARCFGTVDAEITPWADRLARHALTWVGGFEAGRLVGFVQVCWDGGCLDSCGFRPTAAGLMRLSPVAG